MPTFEFNYMMIKNAKKLTISDYRSHYYIIIIIISDYKCHILCEVKSSNTMNHYSLVTNII